MRKRIHIDESGDPVLNDDCYVICAVINDENDLDHDSALLREIRNKHGVGKELKSSKVGSNLKRRKDICESLGQLRARFVVMIIMKSRLHKNGGFRFKSSTYKHCQRRLFEKIYKGISQVIVVVDTHGSQDFMDSFAPYINKHFQQDLFSSREIKYSTPIESELLQVADFVGGTVRRFMEKQEDSSAFDTLKPALGMVHVWPRAKEDPHIDVDTSIEDQLVFRHCTHAAEEVLAREKDRVLAETLQYLLYSVGDEDDGFIYGDALLEHLKNEGLIELNKDKGWLRSNVIAKLRNNGALISASRDGYKIPSSVSDLEKFVGFVAQKTMPYLKKVNDMRESIYVGLAGKYDMLDCEVGLKDLMAPMRAGKID